MKKCIFLFLTALTGCCCALLKAGEPPRLLLPDEFYAVPGIETNVPYSRCFGH